MTSLVVGYVYNITGLKRFVKCKLDRNCPFYLFELFALQVARAVRRFPQGSRFPV